MSFGWSAGDIITALTLANQLRQRFLVAPEQYQGLSDDIVSLSNALQHVNDLLSDNTITGWQKTNLEHIIKECNGVLEALQKKIDSNAQLSNAHGHGFRDTSRRFMQRIRWDPAEVSDFRQRISMQVGFLNHFTTTVESKTVIATKQGVDELLGIQNIKQQSDHQREVLRWLSPLDFSKDKTDFLGRRQKGTGNWLLTSDNNQGWVTNPKQSLLCHGIPGVGKTILMAIVVDNLLEKFGDVEDVGIAYIFCNFRRQDELSSDALLGSLAAQLAQERQIPQQFEDMFTSYKSKGRNPVQEDVSKCMVSIASTYSRVFIVIDALDECQSHDRMTLLSDIFELQKKLDINILASARSIPAIMNEFNHEKHMEVRAIDEDIQKYLAGNMSRLPAFVQRDSDLQEEVKTQIGKAVDGIFLLAHLYITSLEGKSTRKAIKLALQNLPKGSDAYNSAYEDAITRIESQAKDRRELGQNVISWIRFCRRPLTTSELQRALAIEAGTSELDKDNVPDVEDMVSACLGLVTVDETSHTIRLVHYTIQEYLERTPMHWLENGQSHIVISCITLLSFDEFEQEIFPSQYWLPEKLAALYRRLRRHPLYEYAAKNWGFHAQACSQEDNTMNHLIMSFLQNQKKMSASSFLAKTELQTSGEITRLHLVAYLGIDVITRILLSHGDDPNSIDDHHQTPLTWAVRHGHENIVKILANEDGVDVNRKDISECTPLFYACERGSAAIQIYSLWLALTLIYLVYMVGDRCLVLQRTVM